MKKTGTKKLECKQILFNASPLWEMKQYDCFANVLECSLDWLRAR